MGMGASGTAAIEGFHTGYFNPASLAWTDAITLGASYQEWFADLETADVRLSGGHRWDPGGSGAVWRIGGSLGYSTLRLNHDVPERTIFLPEGTGTTFSVDDYFVSGTVGSAYERGLFALAVGGAAKYLREESFGGNRSVWAFDLGVIVALPYVWRDYIFRPRVGYAETNLSNGMTFGDREIEITGERRWAFGIDLKTPVVDMGSGTWRRSVSVVGISIDHDRILRRDLAPEDTRTATGFELNIFETVQIRYGVSDRSYSGDEDGTTYGFGLGWDFGRVLFQMDYARVKSDFFLVQMDENVFGLIIGTRY